MPPSVATVSLNDRAGALLDAALADAALLRLGVSEGPGGETVVDCGLEHPGGLEAGLRLARICTAGLAEVALLPSGQPSLPWGVLLRTGQPVLATLASQYAGWRLVAEDGTPLLGSGPARALARREALFAELAHREAAARAVLVLEGAARPAPDLAEEVAEACALPRSAVALLHAPTGSLAGTVQIAARAVECAIQKARAQGLPLEGMVEAVGLAPVAPPHPDARTAMARANDAIIYGARVQLVLDAPRDEARTLARALPSRTAPEWGRSFAEVYEAAGGDFARIDASLFSPAEVAVTSLRSGETFRSGRIDTLRLHTFLEAD